jgi:hypothetical protein
MMVLCSRCRRHYRHTDSCCPFCGGHRSAAVQRLGFGLAVAIGVSSSIGCGGETDTAAAAYGPPPSGGTTAGGATGTGGSAKGGAATGGATTTTTGGTGRGGAPAYAVPPSGGATTGGRTGSGGMLVAYGPAPVGGTNLGGTSMVTAYGTPPATGGTSVAGGSHTAGSAGASSAASVACLNGPSGLGWYQGSTLICTSRCQGCTATCVNVGTKSEGWYTICQSLESACNISTPGLIKFASCAAAGP